MHCVVEKRRFRNDKDILSHLSCKKVTYINSPTGPNKAKAGETAVFNRSVLIFVKSVYPKMLLTRLAKARLAFNCSRTLTY